MLWKASITCEVNFSSLVFFDIPVKAVFVHLWDVFSKDHCPLVLFFNLISEIYLHGYLSLFFLLPWTICLTSSALQKLGVYNESPVAEMNDADSYLHADFFTALENE